MVLREAVTGIILAVILTVMFMGMANEINEKDEHRTSCSCKVRETCCHRMEAPCYNY